MRGARTALSARCFQTTRTRGHGCPRSATFDGLWTTLVLGALLLSGCTGREAGGQRAGDLENNPFIVSPAKGGQSSSQKLASALQLAGETRAKTGGTITIHLRGGTYFLDEPLVLRPEHSGIALVAYRGEKPVLSGGRRVTGWKETTVNGKKLWATDIPEACDGKWFFRELWVNGERRVRARHPNQGYFNIEKVLDKTASWGVGQTRFQFREGDLKAWPTLTNAEMVVMSRWVESRLPVTNVDEAQHLVNFSKQSVVEFQVADCYYLEHAFEALDAPGEWYLDSASGRLFYAPMPGEIPDHIEAIAPVLTQVMRIQGQPQAGQFVELNFAD
jgi:hypothetical protein